MIHRAPSPVSRSAPDGAAFTLIELLVVIGIIGALVAILVPTVSKIRISAQKASTQNFVVQLTGAIERYHQDFQAYPGPLAYSQIYTNTVAPSYLPDFTDTTPYAVDAASGFDTTMSNSDRKFTMSENLVLGLLGGLHRVVNNPATPDVAALHYNPSFVGNGPVSLNGLNPKKYNAYMDPQNLSWRTTAAGKTGKYQDEAGAADDSLVPEFVDSFADPMPILYLRARKGASTAGTTNADNPVITDLTTTNRVGQYDLSQIIAYTATYSMQTIGVGKSVKGSNYAPTPLSSPTYYPHGLSTVDVNASMDKNALAPKVYKYPYDAYPYFTSPSQPNTARNKDGFILISAGPDRVYGTEDDITNFGSVNQ